MVDQKLYCILGVVIFEVPVSERIQALEDVDTVYTYSCGRVVDADGKLEHGHCFTQTSRAVRLVFVLYQASIIVLDVLDGNGVK